MLPASRVIPVADSVVAQIDQPPIVPDVAVIEPRKIPSLASITQLEPSLQPCIQLWKFVDCKSLAIGDSQSLTLETAQELEPPLAAAA